MSELERTAGGVIVCGFEGDKPPKTLRRWLEDDIVAGLILFRRNITDIWQTTSLIADCRQSSGASLPILACVDQEGGRVARFGDPILQLPPMRTLAAQGDPSFTRQAAKVLGTQLRSIGINLDFAPVLDVDTNPLNPVIGDRAFGSLPEVVIEHALAFAQGLHDGGVLSCGKHFPGHGDTDLDSHWALPTLRHDRSRLEEIELRPFRAAVEILPAMMTAHVVFETLDAQRPATMSRDAITELLRSDIGFDGAIFSDDLEMKAVTAHYAIEDAGVMAIEAGCDLLLVCSDLDAAAHLRDALVRRAEASIAFRARLEEARTRADALRAQVTRLPPAMSLENALDSTEANAVAARLQHLE